MRWIIFILIYVLIDIYAYQAMRTLSKNSLGLIIYFLISLAVLAALYFLLNSTGSSNFMAPPRNYLFGIFLALFIPKILLALFMFGEDVMRFFTGIFFKFSGKSSSVEK